jgi:transposase
LPWLADVPRNVCTQLLVELGKAFQRCFKMLTRAPRFKRKGRETCSSCGHVDAGSRSAEAFRCCSCGNSDHADLNAAKVLKSRVNRSALPPEGLLPVSTRRKVKVVVLRVPRRPPQSSAL